MRKKRNSLKSQLKKPITILFLLFSFVAAQQTIAVIEFEGKGVSQPGKWRGDGRDERSNHIVI